MKLFNWKGRTSKKAFGDRLQPMLQAALPTATLERTDDLGFKVIWPDRDEHATLSLDNAYQEFIGQPDHVDSIAARYVSGLAAILAPPAPLDPDTVLPLIKTYQWLKDCAGEDWDDPRTGAWYTPLNDELVICYVVLRTGFTFLRRDLFAQGEWDEAALRQRALDNLRARTDQFEWVGNRRLRLASTGGNFESALILRPDLFRDWSTPPETAYLIGIPDRDTLVVAINHAPATIYELARGTTQLYRSEGHSISDQVFMWQQGLISTIEQLADDDTHPIPCLDVLDIAATRKGGGASLTIVIASPLDTSPQSILRLWRKIDGYVRYLGSEAFFKECGRPTPDNTDIVFALHRDMPAEIIDLLEGERAWLAERGACLKIEIIGS